MDKFLVESQVNARTQLGLEVGLKFSLSVMKEIRVLSKDMLHNCLSYLYTALSDTTPSSLYGTDKESLLYDGSINDARSFLIDQICDKSNSKELKELCFKIIFRLFLARSSAEDALVLLNLSKNHPEIAQQMDLRQELHALPDLEGTQSGEQTMDFSFTELGQAISLLESKENG